MNATPLYDPNDTSTYPESIIPDQDVATCLKVLRTVRNAALGPDRFNSDAAVVLSTAHATIRDAMDRYAIVEAQKLAKPPRKGDRQTNEARTALIASAFRTDSDFGKLQVKALCRLLGDIKIRIIFSGHPGEPIYRDGDKLVPDWSEAFEQIELLTCALERRLKSETDQPVEVLTKDLKLTYEQIEILTAANDHYIATEPGALPTVDDAIRYLTLALGSSSSWLTWNHDSLVRLNSLRDKIGGDMLLATLLPSPT